MSEYVENSISKNQSNVRILTSTATNACYEWAQYQVKKYQQKC